MPVLLNRKREHLTRVWHRLTPGPDSISGLQRLKAGFIITTLSNGNIALLTEMAKHAALPWDCVLSAENIRRYKPDAEIYRLVPGVFDRRPDQVMLVAAHEHDSQAAQSHGLRTATSTARSNTGRENHPALRRMGDFDVVAVDF